MSPPTSNHPTSTPNRRVFRTGSPSSISNHLTPTPNRLIFKTGQHASTTRRSSVVSNSPSVYNTIFQQVPIVMGERVQYKLGDKVLRSLPPTLFVPHSLRWVEGEHGIWVYPEVTPTENSSESKSLMSLLELFRFLRKKRWAIDALSRRFCR